MKAHAKEYSRRLKAEDKRRKRKEPALTKPYWRFVRCFSIFVLSFAPTPTIKPTSL
jgi:hypothetical protein